jgi:glycosyltransferase involved in cell wall biosynthesis
MAKSYVIPNGVNDEWFNHVKQKDNLPYKGNINIACVGKVNRNKNQLFLVNVCQRLNRLGYGITLSIVGPIQNKFIAHIIQRKSNVKLLSPMTKYELMNFYSTQHIMALASIHETFGIVYAEAMTQGLPVIYTKDQGFDNFFRDGTVGYSVKPRDSKQMKVCIDKILENYLKISNTCIDLSKEKFCWNLISNQYDELYKEVVQ